MANKSVFASIRGALLPAADTRNVEGDTAYGYEDAHALVQLAMTGTFGSLFYSVPKAELARTVELARCVEPELLAKIAVYARQNGHMKDMPAVLLAVLSTVDADLFRAVFGRVVDNGKMLRTFVQVMRSGQTGRKSLVTRPKAMVADWLNGASDGALLKANIGNDPSLADVIKMVHPKPASAARAALYAWILGKPCDALVLPEAVRTWMAFKETGDGAVPDVPFQMLTQLPLTTDHWAQIASNASWQMLRMNLNTLLRHKVLERADMVAHVAAALRDPERIRAARAFPYQLMMAASALSKEMPSEIREALQDAMEVAVENVPRIEGSVAVCPDVSGSMGGSVTGYRPGATSRVRHIDVAALVAAAVLRTNRKATVPPFEHVVRPVRLEPRDTILTNAAKLAALGGGGTNVSAPLDWLIKRKEAPDVVIFVSDNQSWVDASAAHGTAMMKRWAKLKARNPKAKLIAIDIAPYGTTQAAERSDVLNIGGFSDGVFRQIADFAAGRMGPQHWLGEIDKVSLD